MIRHPLGWALAILIIVFVVGMTTGRAVGIRERGPMTPAVAPPSDPGMMAGVIEQLELAPDQRAMVNQILERRGTQTNLIMEEAVGTLRALIDSTGLEIREVLNEQQRARFDSLLTAERSQFRMRQPRRARD